MQARERCSRLPMKLARSCRKPSQAIQNTKKKKKKKQNPREEELSRPRRRHGGLSAALQEFVANSDALQHSSVCNRTFSVCQQVNRCAESITSCGGSFWQEFGGLDNHSGICSNEGPQDSFLRPAANSSHSRHCHQAFTCCQSFQADIRSARCRRRSLLCRECICKEACFVTDSSPTQSAARTTKSRTRPFALAYGAIAILISLVKFVQSIFQNCDLILDRFLLNFIAVLQTKRKAYSIFLSSLILLNCYQCDAAVASTDYSLSRYGSVIVLLTLTNEVTPTDAHSHDDQEPNGGNTQRANTATLSQVDVSAQQSGLSHVASSQRRMRWSDRDEDRLSGTVSGSSDDVANDGEEDDDEDEEDYYEGDQDVYYHNYFSYCPPTNVAEELRQISWQRWREWYHSILAISRKESRRQNGHGSYVDIRPAELTYAWRNNGSSLLLQRTIRAGLSQTTSNTAGDVSSSAIRSSSSSKKRRHLNEIYSDSTATKRATNAGIRQTGCVSFDKAAIEELCRLQGQHRTKLMKRIDVFSEQSCNVAENRTHVLSLYDLFLLDVRTDRDLEDPKKFAHLTADVSRLLMKSSDQQKLRSECVWCFGDILNSTIRALHFSAVFFQTIEQTIDCSETDDFSVTSSCEDCKGRYREWLLMSFLADSAWKPWKATPCFGAFCEITELFCPHMRNTQKDDYAGLPSYRCSDPYISNSSRIDLPGCLHPCRLKNGAAESKFCTAFHKKRTRDRRPLSTSNGSRKLSSGKADFASSRKSTRKPAATSAAIDASKQRTSHATTATATTTAQASAERSANVQADDQSFLQTTATSLSTKVLQQHVMLLEIILACSITLVNAYLSCALDNVCAHR